MALTVNTNVASLTAQRQLGSSQTMLSTSLERLSSGLRINSAKDDAAGLAISERFTAQIKGLNQGVRNANDGISLAQTAEGALKEVTSNLQRIRELAVQSANATNSTSDRQSLQIEVQALLDEIDRVSTDTKFNGTAIIDGSFANKAFQVGASSGETVSITSIGSSKTADLGGSYSSTLTSGAVDGSGISAGDVFVNGIDAGASADDGVSTVNADGSALAIATAINTTTSQSGVSATATTEKVAAADYTGGTSGEVNFITINDTNVSWSNGADATATGSAVIDAINDKTATTGVTAALDTSTGRIGLTAADGRTIEIGASISTNGAAVSGFSASTTTYGTVTYTGSSIAGIQLNDAAADAVADGSSAVTAADANGALGTITAQTSTAVTGGLDTLSVATVSGATAALTAIDTALDTVNSTRAELGAIQNRFQSIVSNAQTTSENLSASRSRIVDADFAAETASMTKAQILQQSGIAMLAQANSIPQNVLALLQ